MSLVSVSVVTIKAIKLRIWLVKSIRVLLYRSTLAVHFSNDLCYKHSFDVTAWVWLWIRAKTLYVYQRHGLVWLAFNHWPAQVEYKKYKIAHKSRFHQMSISSLWKFNEMGVTFICATTFDEVLFSHKFKLIVKMGICSRNDAGIILWMHTANERRLYNVTSSLIDWAHSKNDPWWWHHSITPQTQMIYWIYLSGTLIKLDNIFYVFHVAT